MLRQVTISQYQGKPYGRVFRSKAERDAAVDQLYALKANGALYHFVFTTTRQSWFSELTIYAQATEIGHRALERLFS